MTADKHLGFHEESIYGFESTYGPSTFRFDEPMVGVYSTQYWNDYSNDGPSYPFPIFETKLIDGEYVVEELS